MSWLSSFFSSGPKEAISIGSVLKTDVHSHFIPGIDDGAATLEDSISLIRGMADLGYTRLITTPHIMSDFYRNTPEIIMSGLEQVREAIKQEGIPVTLDAAAEYYCDAEFEKRIGNEPLLSFSGKYVLMELSYMNPSDYFETVTFKLQLEGYIPVLAHPERYPYWNHNIEHYAAIRDKGVLLQVNIASLTGHYGTSARRTAERLIESNLVDLLGSDVHKQSHIDLLNKAGKEKYLKNLLASGRLVNDQL